MSTTKNFYKANPLYVSDGIPIFSENDHYIENYDRISSDHLSSFERTGKNPFMDEDHWNEIDSSTEVIVRRSISKYLNKTVRALDVGVGMGRLLEKFPSLECYGMDISRKYLNYARSKGIEVCLSRIEDMPYHDEYFDIIISTDVLEHVVDLNLCVKKILEILKYDGILVVRVPYKEYLSSYFREDYPYELVHLRNFDEYGLRALFEKIFKHEVLEHSFAGYQNGNLRFFNVDSIFNRASKRILKIVGKIHRKSFIFLSERLCRPVEINLVVRKSKSDYVT